MKNRESEGAVPCGMANDSDDTAGGGNENVLWDLVAAATGIHVVRTFVTLGVADAVPAEGIDVERLSEAVGARSDRLRRLLWASSGLGLCDISTADVCMLRPAGAALRSDSDNPVRTWVMLMTAPWIQRAWAHLPDAVRDDGRVAFDEANGTSFWGYLAADADAESLFDRAMAASAPARARAVQDVVGRFGPTTVVDVGGGNGSLLAAVLDGCPGARGVLVERPAVARGAAEAHARGVAPKCRSALPRITRVSEILRRRWSLRR